MWQNRWRKASINWLGLPCFADGLSARLTGRGQCDSCKAIRDCLRDAPNLSDAPLRSLRFWGSALFFFSGLTGLVYEILWTRRLNLTFGHGILAVSTVVTAYMGGLALGSALGGRWSDRRITQGESAAWFLAT